MSHGISVDSRIVEDRQIDRRHQGAAKDPPVGFGNRDAFCLGDRRNARPHQGKRLLHPHQVAAEGERIAAKLRHSASRAQVRQEQGREPFAEGFAPTGILANTRAARWAHCHVARVTPDAVPSHVRSRPAPRSRHRRR